MGSTFDPIKDEWRKGVGVSKKEPRAEWETGVKHSELQQANKSIARMLLVRQGDLKASIFDDVKHQEFAVKLLEGVPPDFKNDMEQLCDNVGFACQQITKSDHGPVHPERRLAAFRSVMDGMKNKLEEQQKEQLSTTATEGMSEDGIKDLQEAHLKQLAEFDRYYTEQRKLLCYAMLASDPGRQAIAVEKISKMVGNTERHRLSEANKESLSEGAEVISGESKELKAGFMSDIKNFFDKETRTSYKVNAQGQLQFNVAGVTDPKKLDRIVDTVLTYAHAQGWDSLNTIETKKPAFAKKLYLAACAQGLIDDKNAGLGIFKPAMDMATLQKPGGDPYGFLKVIEQGEELRAKAKQTVVDPKAQKTALGEEGDLKQHARGGKLRDAYHEHQQSNSEFAKNYKEAVDNYSKPQNNAENVSENDAGTTPSPSMRT